MYIPASKNYEPSPFIKSKLQYKISRISVAYLGRGVDDDN